MVYTGSGTVDAVWTRHASAIDKLIPRPQMSQFLLLEAVDGPQRVFVNDGRDLWESGQEGGGRGGGGGRLARGGRSWRQVHGVNGGGRGGERVISVAE